MKGKNHNQLQLLQIRFLLVDLGYNNRRHEGNIQKGKGFVDFFDVQKLLYVLGGYYDGFTTCEKSVFNKERNS